MAVAEQFITGETIQVAEEYRRKKATSVLTIVFTDIAQSTALLESLGEEVFHKLREEHEEFLRETVEFDKAGALVRCLGDGSLLVFSETSTAVERCLRIQSAMSSHQCFRLRIGLDLGQVSLALRGGIVEDAFGRHVNRAARIQGLAQPGHILTSFNVYDCAVGWLRSKSIKWHSHGGVMLRGFEESALLYEPFVPGVLAPQPSQDLPRIDASGRLGSMASFETQRQADYQRERKLSPLDESHLVASDNPITEEAYLLKIKDLLKNSTPAGGPAGLSGAQESKRGILWVGAEYSEWHARALTEAGCELERASSGSVALERLRNTQHSLIISEVGPRQEPTEALDFLTKVRAALSGSQDRLPVIFLASLSRAAEFREEAIAKGALACTAGTVSLFEAVYRVLRAESPYS